MLAAETISRAIGVASSGDTIYLKGGLYTGSRNRNLLISRKSLVIRGSVSWDAGGDIVADSTPSVLDAQGLARHFAIWSSVVNVSDLVCTGGTVGPLSISDGFWRSEGGGSVQQRGHGTLVLRNVTVTAPYT